jgi:hypothetical protein
MGFEPLAKGMRGEGQKRPPVAKEEQETVFLSGGGWGCYGEILDDFLQFVENSSADSDCLRKSLPIVYSRLGGRTFYGA